MSQLARHRKSLWHNSDFCQPVLVLSLSGQARRMRACRNDVCVSQDGASPHTNTRGPRVICRLLISAIPGLARMQQHPAGLAFSSPVRRAPGKARVSFPDVKHWLGTAGTLYKGSKSIVGASQRPSDSGASLVQDSRYMSDRPILNGPPGSKFVRMQDTPRPCSHGPRRRRRIPRFRRISPYPSLVTLTCHMNQAYILVFFTPPQTTFPSFTFSCSYSFTTVP